MSALTLGFTPGDSFYISVAAVDKVGHESLFSYPEVRCDSNSCVVPPYAFNVTAPLPPPPANRDDNRDLDPEFQRIRLPSRESVETSALPSLFSMSPSGLSLRRRRPHLRDFESLWIGAGYSHEITVLGTLYDDVWIAQSTAANLHAFGLR